MEGMPHFDVVNPGAYTDKVKAKVEDTFGTGVKRYHVTAAPGADPVKVEREMMMALDRMKHGAVYRVADKHDGWFARLTWPVVDRFRVIKYKLLHERAFLKSLNA